MRPAERDTRLFQHRLRTLHITSFTFGHSAAQLDGPVCGPPAPFTCHTCPDHQGFACDKLLGNLHGVNSRQTSGDSKPYR